jgi:type 1 fimbriae regulatory protein FimB
MITNIRPRKDRSREHLTPEEVVKLLTASKDKSLSRTPERDYCLLLLMVRHGLRVSEACGLKLSDVDLQGKVMHVKRLKQGKSTTHPLYNGEVKAIQNWMVKRQEMSLDALTLGAGDTLFISERRTPLSRSMVWVLIDRYATAAGLACLNIHPHMLRHACGYDLANRGADTRLIQGFLGHQNIQHTVKYTELDPKRFASLY